MSDNDGGEDACLAHRLDLELDDALLAQLFRDLADAVVIADRSGTIVFWNDAATALFGWSALEVGGKTLELIVPERLWARHDAGYTRVMETGHTEYGNRLLQVPTRHRDGHTFSIAFTVTLLYRRDFRLPVGVAAVIRDDTANFEARRAAAKATAGR